ncbi:MAG: hypothetical protein ABI707_10575 [Ferruginibacter sp.]
MKKLVTVLAVAAMLFSSFAFATGSDNVNPRVKAAFSNDFSAASNVSWEKLSDFYFAKFILNNLELNAAYNEEGELVGTSRSMGSSLLPVSISMAIAKKYEGYTVSEKALELTYQDETHYYLTVSNDRQALKLKCSINGTLEVVRKLKKN